MRDLPSKDGSVEPDKDFEMHWDVDGQVSEGHERNRRRRQRRRQADPGHRPRPRGRGHLLAHPAILQQRKALKKDTPVERVTFNAVTKQADLAALNEPREIDAPLVDAYLARRALDYLVGFTLSPVLWRKLPGARSAGRVQSVALRLVCDREAEIEAFRTDEYWTIEATLATAKGEEFPARLDAIDGKTLDEARHQGCGDQANAIKAAIEKGEFTVVSVEKKAVKRNPFAPFTTSTLQQEASRKLGFSAKQTMQVAQRLYEGVDLGGETVGLITYMRTDGVTIVPEAITAIRGLIAREYSQSATSPPFIREYKTKAKNAQEAHEAIRPTDVARKPADVARYLERDQARLYELIWKRAVASQMASAELEQTTADIEVQGPRRQDLHAARHRLHRAVRRLPQALRGGPRRAPARRQGQGRHDRGRRPAAASRRSPRATALTDRGDRGRAALHPAAAALSRRRRWSRSMEELGIGRPSTYASTLAVLQERDYVRIDKKRLIPEDKGRLVTAFLESFFKRYVEYDFTADLEEKLDLISDGKLEWKDVLRDFWRDFTGAVDEIKDLRVGDVLEALNELLGPHIFPPARGRRRPAHLPHRARQGVSA